MDTSTQGPGAVQVQKEFRVRSPSKDPGTVHESRWVISVPHTAMKDVGGQMVERPYGVSHARQAGHALTACGRYAVGWRIFWECRSRRPLLTLALRVSKPSQCWPAHKLVVSESRSRHGDSGGLPR